MTEEIAKFFVSMGLGFALAVALNAGAYGLAAAVAGICVLWFVEIAKG